MFLSLSQNLRFCQLPRLREPRGFVGELLRHGANALEYDIPPVK